ncbi:hypothetical protein ACFL6U_23335 [Planctomycetota bacterium]
MVSEESAYDVRNLMIAAIVICLLIAYSGNPDLDQVKHPTAHRIVWIVILILALLSTFVIRGLAGHLYDIYAKPWYGHITAIFFIAIMMTLMAGLVYLAILGFVQGSVIGLAWLKWGILIYIACTLSMIVAIDWPYGGFLNSGSIFTSSWSSSMPANRPTHYTGPTYRPKRPYRSHKLPKTKKPSKPKENHHVTPKRKFT